MANYSSFNISSLAYRVFFPEKKAHTTGSLLNQNKINQNDLPMIYTPIADIKNSPRTGRKITLDNIPDTNNESTWIRTNFFRKECTRFVSRSTESHL